MLDVSPKPLMNARLALLAISLAALFPFDAFAADPPRLVAHEWGTFTSLQDEAGEAIGGINADDEPVPQFVRRLASGFLIWPRASLPYATYKGGVGFEPGSTFKVVTTGHCDPDVKLRLETPVLYFYPSPGATLPPFDVHVTFHGGWLSEYYPDAEARAPGFDAANPDRLFTIGRAPDRQEGFDRGFGHLRPEANGELLWKGVQLGVDGAGPDTSEKVWLAPRAVPSAMLQTAAGEREKFLFYRGVGCGPAALRVVRDAVHGTLEIRDSSSSSSSSSSSKSASSHFAASSPIAAAWLVEVRTDGQCAFRSLGALAPGAQPRLTVPAFFTPQDFSEQRLASLQAEMHAVLVQAGLFAPEADALLNTWQVSYFKSPGLRLFYLCPPAEVEAMLPLQISIPCAVTRVMIGRIEIVTPAQREVLASIAAGAPPNPKPENPVNPPAGFVPVDFGKLPAGKSISDPPSVTPEAWAKLVVDNPAGDPTIKLLPRPANPLGRFPNALLLDEEKHRPTAALHEYIEKHGFTAYQFR
jgi:hypothetical protein